MKYTFPFQWMKALHPVRYEVHTVRYALRYIGILLDKD